MAKQYTKKFYNSKEWQGIRDSILKRDNYLCQLCGNPAEEVHHIVHVNQANVDKAETHRADNLISLCRDCHCRQHDKDRHNTSDVGEGFYFDGDGNIQRTAPR